jgi:hypothetical protein
MDLQITSELKEGILVVTTSGSIAFDEALRLLKQVFDTAKEKEVNKILVNGLAMDGELQRLTGIASQKNSSRTFGSTVSRHRVVF